MSFSYYLLVLTLGAGVIALWLEARFGELGPRTTGRTLLHLGLCFAVLQLCPFGIKLIVAGTEDPARKIAAVFLVVFPALVYAFLATLWLLKLIQGMARLR
jgi:hypothetical protein